MRDTSIEQTSELERTSLQAMAQDDIRIEGEALARLQRKARRLQGAALGGWLAGLFSRKPADRATDEQAIERNGNVDVLRRLRDSAARLLGSRAIHGPASDHLLADVGLTRRDVEGVRVPDVRSYRVDSGSTAA